MRGLDIKKRLGAVFVGFVLVAGNAWAVAPVAQAAPGDSEEEPIVITDCEELQAIDDDAANYSKHYALENDIDCSDTANWNGWKGFDPIASDGTPFTGTFNGNHHTIINLTINRANDTPGYQAEDDEESVGLFAWTQNVEIYDLNIDTSKVKGYAYVGGIVGYAETTTLTNVSFNATVAADDSCNPGHCVWARYGYAGGGLVGTLHNSTIVNGVTAGPVKGSGNTIGGLVGQMGNNSGVTSSSSSSNIDGGNNLGGAVGSMLGGTLEDVHASGSIVANVEEDFKNGYTAGGLVGRMEGTASVTHSSATGNVHADWQAAGGLVGRKDGLGAITDAYARGNVTQTGGWTDGGEVGGLVGEFNDGVIDRTYASGSVSGEYKVGGLVGVALGSDENTIIRNSFAAGAVTQNGEEDDPFDGGFIGHHYPWVFDIENNYYDADNTGMDHCYGWYPEGYADSDATIPGECTAINTDDVPNATYFYNSSNQPFNNSEDSWSNEIWDFHEDDYPTFECEQCVVINEDEEPEEEAAATLQTLQAEDITATSAVMHGEAQLHNGVTIDDIPGNLLVGFHLNTSPTVDWENNTHSAPVDDVSEIEEDGTHIAFSGEIDGLECETQYWYVAAYTYTDIDTDEWDTADNVETFTTSACPVEDDNDGIPTEVEEAAPNDGDANNDEIADSEQANVASFVNPTNNQYVTIALHEDCEISSASITSEGDNWTEDEGYNYQSGLLNFTADCGEDGFTTTATVYQHGTTKQDAVLRKYNPNTQTYFTITDADVTDETIGGQAVVIASYSITDGQELDIDGEENGIIVDPVGLATTAASAGVDDNASDSGDLATSGSNLVLMSMVSFMTITAAVVLRRHHDLV